MTHLKVKFFLYSPHFTSKIVQSYNMGKITIKVKNLKGLKLISEDKRQTLIEIVHLHQIDWMHACGKKGRCTTCKAIILEGEENFEPLTRAEQKMIDRNKLRKNERLSCQAIPKGNVLVNVPKMYQLPHMQYGEESET